METTRNTLRAAMAALSAMAVALVAVILVSVHPVFASAAEEPVQGVAEGNISLSVPAATLPCALTADGTVITPDADKYAFVNTGSVAVSIASPEVKLSNGVHDVNMSAKAAVVATTDKDQFKKLFNESDKQIDWILNNQGQGEQTLMQGQSLCVKFGIDPLTYDKNANVIEQAATSSGCNIASVNYAYKESRMAAYAVFFDEGRTAKLYKGYDRPVKGKPYRGSAEPVFDFVDDIENDKAEVFGQYKDVLERVSVETEDDGIQPTTTKGWFNGCSKLADVQGLSKLDTSKVTDMSEMFCSCRGLTSLDVSGFDTSNVTNMNSMFQSCRGLTSLDLSKFDTAKVTNMGIMFWGCSGLTSLDLSKFKTGNVTIMNQMFSGCSKLTSLDVSGLDTSKVETMYEMFCDCKSLTSLDVSKFKTGNVTDMADMFYGCWSLTSLDVSGLDTSKVERMSRMFWNCLKLTSLDISDFDTSNGTNVNAMFYGCYGLEQVTLREGWNVSFSDCGLPETMYVKDGNGSFAKYPNVFPTAKTDTYYTENEINKQAFAVIYDDGNGGRAAKLYNRAKVPAAGKVFEGDTVTEVITGIENKPGAFKDNGGTTLTAVAVVDDGIQPTTTKGWFDGCSKLAGVQGLSKLDTSKVTDMSDMFLSCSGLASLDVSGFDTSNVTNMNFMFCGCSGLTSLDVSGLDTSNVTNMGGMFASCRSLTSLDVSKFKTGNVTIMNQMFYNCRDLALLDVSGLDTSKVETMYEMFCDCKSLTSLDVSKFKTGNVTDMADMFYGCWSLTSLDVSGLDTSKVERMSRMFWNCLKLTSLDISDFDTSNGTNVNAMFYGCYGLEQVTLREGWNVSFSDCGLPETMYVKDGNGSFAKYPNVFPTAKTDTYYTENEINKQAFAVIYDDGNGGRAAKLYNRAKVPAAGKVFEGDTVTEVITGIENKPGAFKDNGGTTLTAVAVVDDGIQPTTTKGWFDGCSKLAGVQGLSKLDTSKVTDMSDMFLSCSGLASLDVSGFDTSNVTNMGGMFFNCSGLTSLDVPKFNTGKVTAMNQMFYGCSGLTSLDLSGLDTGNVTDMGQMFYGCSGLTSLDLLGLDTGNVTDMRSMFCDCRGLTSLNLSGWNTGNVDVMAFMFSGCSGLTSLKLSGWNTAKVTNMVNMFSRCSGLTSLDLSSFNTAKVTNMGSMFNNCNSLKTVVFPSDSNSKAKLQKALSDCWITLRSSQSAITEDANSLSASDSTESRQLGEGVENRSFEPVGSESLSGSTASAAANAPSSNVSSAGKAEADFPGQSGGSELKEPSGEKADNCQPDSDGNLSSDKSGSSAHMK